MIRFLTLAFFLAFSTVVQAGPYLDYANKLLKSSKFRPDLEAVISGLANSYRASEGKEQLKVSPMLLKAARAHAADMAAHGFMGHRSSNGYDFDSRMHVWLGNPMFMPSMAENAAQDTQGGPADAAKARRLFVQWVKSRPHRKSLVNRTYQFVSTGVVQKGDDIWAVQIFWSNPPQTNLGGGTLQ
jgi:uncharacterized protein YkwD